MYVFISFIKLNVCVKIGGVRMYARKAKHFSIVPVKFFVVDRPHGFVEGDALASFCDGRRKSPKEFGWIADHVLGA